MQRILGIMRPFAVAVSDPADGSQRARPPVTERVRPAAAVGWVTPDLSHGWGANSQWGTDFRRDNVDAGVLHYNVDARERRPGAADSGLSELAARDLLRHRCSIRENLRNGQAPWDFTLAERWP